MTTFQEISDHMTCYNECSDVISVHRICTVSWMSMMLANSTTPVLRMRMRSHAFDIIIPRSGFAKAIAPDRQLSLQHVLDE